MYMRVKHVKVSAVKNKHYIKNTAAARVGMFVVHENVAMAFTLITNSICLKIIDHSFITLVSYTEA